MIEPPRERKVRLLTEPTDNTGIIVDIIHFILCAFARNKSAFTSESTL